MPVSLGAVLIGAAFCLPAFGVALWVMACGERRRSGRELARIREVIDRNRTVCACEIAAVSRNLEALEISGRSADELLCGGRLSQSDRARAMQLLRAGIAPDTAAVTLGMATREVRLLAEISRLLAIPGYTKN